MADDEEKRLDFERNQRAAEYVKTRDESQWVVDKAVKSGHEQYVAASDKADANLAGAVDSGVDSANAAFDRASKNVSGAVDGGVNSTGAAFNGAGDNISGAVNKSANRFSSIADSRRAEWGQVSSSNSAKFTATFADIDQMSKFVQKDVDDSLAESIRVGSSAFNPELLASAILSLGTSAAAESAITFAAGRLGIHSATALGVGIVSATIVSTYQLADSTLSATAVMLGATGDFLGEGFRSATDITTVTVEGVVNVVGSAAAGSFDVVTSSVAGAGDVLANAAGGIINVAGTAVAGTVDVAANLIDGFGQVTGAWVETAEGALAALSTLPFVIDLLVQTVGAGFFDEGVESLVEGIIDTFFDGDIDLWMVATNPLGTLESVLNSTRDHFSADEAWDRTYDNLDEFLNENKSTFDREVKVLAWALNKLGSADGGTLHLESLISTGEEGERRQDFRDKVRETLGITIPKGDIKPDSLQDLVLTMGQVDQIGGEDQGVIRVIQSSSTPPAFTLVYPSTQDWDPLKSKIPNDVLGNLNIISGDSALMEAGKKALDASIKAYYADPKNSQVPYPPPVLVDGFSQGGIAAGGFAEKYGAEYNVKAVFVVGTTISNSHIDPNIEVFVYESKYDPVTHLKTQPNSADWHVTKGDNGGGQLGASHNALLYSDMVKDNPPQDSRVLNQFLDPNSEVTDYFVRKD